MHSPGTTSVCSRATDTSNWQVRPRMPPDAGGPPSSIEHCSPATRPRWAHARIGTTRPGETLPSRPGAAFGCGARESNRALRPRAAGRAGDWPADQTVAGRRYACRHHERGTRRVCRCIGVTTGSYGREALADADAGDHGPESELRSRSRRPKLTTPRNPGCGNVRHTYVTVSDTQAVAPGQQVRVPGAKPQRCVTSVAPVTTRRARCPTTGTWRSATRREHPAVGPSMSSARYCRCPIPSLSSSFRENHCPCPLARAPHSGASTSSTATKMPSTNIRRLEPCSRLLTCPRA